MCDIEYAIAGDRLTEEGDLFVPDEEDPTYFRKAAAPYHLTPFKGRYSISDAVPDPLQVQNVPFSEAILCLGIKTQSIKSGTCVLGTKRIHFDSKPCILGAKSFGRNGASWSFGLFDRVSASRLGG